jgi:hypothetical protein
MGGYIGATAEMTAGESELFDCAKTAKAQTAIASKGIANFEDLILSYPYPRMWKPNAGLQLRRAITIQAEGQRLLAKDAIAPSAARLCSAARFVNDRRPRNTFRATK